MFFRAIPISSLNTLRFAEASDFTSPKRLSTLSIFSTISLRYTKSRTSSLSVGKVSASVGKNFCNLPTCSVIFFIRIKDLFSSRKSSIIINFSSCSISSYSLKGMALALSKLDKNSEVFFNAFLASSKGIGRRFANLSAVF